jgi:UDP-N-acetylmuramoyl-tripeptide--D-alanyl-D-alanine ligase
MRGWNAEQIAAASGAHPRIRDRPAPSSGFGDADRPYPGPGRAVIDSRTAGPGDLFVGLRGEHADGGEYAAHALRTGAWGVLVTPEHADAAAEATTGGVVLAHPDPLEGLQALARAWRQELRRAGAKVVAITGSTGKTSTKDILAAMLSSRSQASPAQPDRESLHERAEGLRTVASPENFNTEIGLPLAVLAAPGDTEVLVLEMAMRGAGQIAELTRLAEPDVGVILNVGPVHLQLLGSLEAIAAAKAELIAGLAPGATLVIPTNEPLLAPHLRADLATVTFGEGGDVELVQWRADGEAVLLDRTPAGGPQASAGPRARRWSQSREPTHAGRKEALVSSAPVSICLRPSFTQVYNLGNLVAAVAVARALGVTPEGTVQVRFSALRGERLALPEGVVLIDDCYNANPMSMRAAIDDLAETAPARRVAVLGDMLELGPDAARLHREVGQYAAARGIELLVTVGPLAVEMRNAFAGEAHSVGDAAAAAELLGTLLREGDTVLVKGSRRVGLERVAEALGSGLQPAREQAHDAWEIAPSVGPGQR